MAIAPFLAMTAAEMYAVSSLPSKVAWMACHFSPYGLGLSNLPQALPTGSLLLVDDVTPPHGHDPVLIAKQLSACAERLQCSGILLDFQRGGCRETKSIAAHLTAALSYPTAVSEPYAEGLSCPIFLPYLPPSVSLEAYHQPWKGREVWLELSLDSEIITLTEKGTQTLLLPYSDLQQAGFAEQSLHCHYSIQTNEKSARFTLWRTKEDLNELLEEAESLGITAAVGLYQELK